MDSFEQEKTATIKWLSHNKKFIIEQCQDYYSQYKHFMSSEPVEYHQDIKEQFKETIEHVVTKEIQYNLNISIETVIIILEEIDILKFLDLI